MNKHNNRQTINTRIKDKTMTKKQALQKLKSGRVLYTNMLEALDVSFEQFLRVAQWNEVKVQRAYDKLIKREEAKLMQYAN